MAVLVLREGCALASDTRASFMQAVRDVDWVVIGRRGVADPVGQGNRGDCAGGSAQVHPEGDTIDHASGHVVVLRMRGLCLLCMAFARVVSSCLEYGSRDLCVAGWCMLLYLAVGKDVRQAWHSRFTSSRARGAAIVQPHDKQVGDK